MSEANAPMNTPLEALERLKAYVADDLATISDDDLRAVISAFEAQGERLREVEGAALVAKAMADNADYNLNQAGLTAETGQCASVFRDIYDALAAALTQPPAMGNGE